MIVFALLASIALITIAIELIYYTLLIPDLSQNSLKTHPLLIYLGKAAYITAYMLSLLRAPLGLLPYLAKLLIVFVLNIPYDSPRSTYLREVVNMAGDFVNLGLTTVLIEVVGGNTWHPQGVPLHFGTLLTCILYLPIAAELVRLITERVPITFSVFWQLLPHRSIARTLQARKAAHLCWRWPARCLARYCRYYALDDTDRASYVLQALKQRATGDSEIENRLEYMRAFRIIPRQCGLRGGKVRDVAKGEVFIHSTWTSDPWLLAGMVMRRAPWMFDPRYLRRPFYYMTEANRLATLFVLEHARYSPPYAVFQFGHEIRVARLHLFYSLLRWIGLDIEFKVKADGTFQFDQVIWELEQRFRHGQTCTEQRPLSTDDEVIADILHKQNAIETLTALDIAVRYTYPLKYVEEVLLDKIREAE